MKTAKRLSETGWKNEVYVIKWSSPLKYAAWFDWLSWVLLTPVKYTTGFKQFDTSVKQKVNYVGNNLKSMHLSIEASLKKLHTSYIDIFYVHWWDYETSVEEVMNGLHNLVTQGKVLYLVHFQIMLFSIDC